MADITQNVTVYSGTVPDANSMTHGEFDAAATELTNYWQVIPPELNAWSSQANSLKSDVNGYRVAAISAKGSAEAARDVALAASNFKGAWASLTGSLGVPASVWHNDSYWMLLTGVANVSAHEPLGAGVVWAPLQVSSTPTPTPTIAAPTITAPTNGATNIGETPTLSASAFTVTNGGSDTHMNTDWRVINDGTSAVVWNSLANSSNKISITVPAGNLDKSTTYRVQARYRGVVYGASDWSTAITFTTADTLGSTIGTAGGRGFGVGIAPYLPAGFSMLTGSDTLGHANYGNYVTANGSVMVFVPRFYYRIGSVSSPRYASYGLNAVDIAGTDTYADEASANAAGYAMHRAFIDGGNVLHGFFIDKYIASKDGATRCKSVFGGVPISLTANTSYTRSDGMTGCTGISADAIVLSRARGAGFHCASLFQYSALALLSLAHGQAATSSTYCAWYDAGGTTNFPKGCNNNALADANDNSVTYTSAGDSGNASKPLAGATANFPRTTHNGQSCGVADLNGSAREVSVGVTSRGFSATDDDQIANGNVYVLKASVSCSDLTGGWDTGNDAWGGVAHLETLYDWIGGFLPWGSDSGNIGIGNGANQVFDEAIGGVGWLRTAAGVPQDTEAMVALGTALFGQDQCFRYNRANLCPSCGGGFGTSISAGVFYRGWDVHRNTSIADSGFRSSMPLAR